VKNLCEDCNELLGSLKMGNFLSGSVIISFWKKTLFCEVNSL